MASSALKPATIASTSNRRNIGTLIPPFGFVKNSRRRNDLQDFRKYLRIGVQQRQWGTVALYCRSILEVALEDLLVSRQPNYRPPGNLGRLISDFLTRDFGMVITAHTADQARLVQALGNLAVHGSGGQFIWTEQRALRLLDMTAVLIHLVWLHHPDVSHQAQEARVQLPDYSAKKTAKAIALEIFQNTKALAAYAELLRPSDPDKLSAILISEEVKEAMQRDIGVVRVGALISWLSRLRELDDQAFKAFVTYEQPEITAALLRVEGLSSVNGYLTLIVRALDDGLLSRGECDQLVASLAADADRIIVKAATAHWRTIMSTANTFRRIPPAQTDLSERLRSLLAISRDVLVDLIRKKQFVAARFLLREWARDRQVSNRMLAKRRYADGQYVFSPAVEELASKVNQGKIALGRLNDILENFPESLRLLFLSFVHKEPLRDLLRLTGPLEVVEFSIIWRSNVNWPDGQAFMPWVALELDQKLASSTIQELSKIPWCLRDRSAGRILPILRAILSAAGRRDALECPKESVKLLWGIAQVAPELQTQIAIALEQSTERWCLVPEADRDSIAIVRGFGCVFLLYDGCEGESIKKASSLINTEELKQYFSSSSSHVWEILLTAFGVYAVFNSSIPDWLPVPALHLLLSEIKAETQLSTKLVKRLRKALP